MIAPDLNLRGSAILAGGLVLLNWATALGPAPGAERAPADEPKTIHLAAGQIVCRPGDMEGNLRQIETLARQTAQAFEVASSRIRENSGCFAGVNHQRSLRFLTISATSCRNAQLQRPW